jgi:hypothetical protein
MVTNLNFRTYGTNSISNVNNFPAFLVKLGLKQLIVKYYENQSLSRTQTINTDTENADDKKTLVYETIKI